MTATKKIRIDRTYSTDNTTDATARNLISVSTGVAGFNALTGVISIPSNTSQLTNGAGFITASDISGKQNTLISGTNIKTINGTSILGSGDLTISGGGGSASTGDLTINGSTITTSTLTTYTSSDWVTAIWWSSNVIYIIGAHSGFASVIKTIQPYSPIVINNVTYTISSISWNDSSGFITTTTNIPNASIDAIKLTDTSVKITNLLVTSLSGGQYGTPLKVFGDTIAIGANSGGSGQNAGAISIGYIAGNQAQGYNAIAIGSQAGSSQQGANAIAIGNMAARNSQPANSIVILANPETTFDPAHSGFYVAPVRSDATPTNIIYYNTVTKEMTYGAAPAGGSGGGGVADVSGYFKNSTSFLNGESISTFSLPATTGPVFAFIYATSSIMFIGPSSWSPANQYGFGGPPGGGYYVSSSPSGPQTINFTSSVYGPTQVKQFVIDASSVTQQFYMAGGMISGTSGVVTVMSPISMNIVPWMTAGYCYGWMNTNGSPDAWIALQAFAPAAGVSIYVSTDPADPNTVYFRCPGIAWNPGQGGQFTVGTFATGPYQIYITAFFFGQ